MGTQQTRVGRREAPLPDPATPTTPHGWFEVGVVMGRTDEILRRLSESLDEAEARQRAMRQWRQAH